MLLSEMALSVVKGLLQQYVQSLLDEGIVNDQFCHIQALRSVEEPDYVVKLINKYFIDVEEIFSEIASHCHHLDIDYPKLISLVQQVKERSSHIGAEHVRLACADLIQAGHQMYKQNFILTLNWIKREFSETKSKMLAIVQMERKIMRLENKQCN